MKKQKDPFPSTIVIIPAINEQDGLALTILELKKYLPNPKILVVDGDSTDMTAKVARSLGADVICEKGKTKGKGNALNYGINFLTGNFDYAVMIDADFTYPAKYIPQMIQVLDLYPQIGMVCGNRFNSHSDLNSMHNLFYFGNRILSFAHNLLNGVAMRDPLSGLRVIRWRILKNWTPKSIGFDVEVELNHHVERKGYDIAEIEIPYRPRIGDKKLKLKHGFSILRRIISEGTLMKSGRNY